MKSSFILFLKGVAMGGANVIPGVSGGTIAFITGVYDKLITSLKSFDLHAIKLLLKFKIKDFAIHINLQFLMVLMMGVLVSLVTFGKAVKYIIDLGEIYEQMVWAFFFGLIMASIYYVGKQIKKWNASVVISGLIGLIIAIVLAFLKPAQENDSFFYLTICGVVAMSSMLLPGLSGSFVLILMGNYRLIMLEAIPDRNLEIILAVGIGAVVGFIILSRIISYLLTKYENKTLSGLTGFIFGSLTIIWPWKEKVYLLDESGSLLLKDGEKVVSGYEWFLPEFDGSVLVAASLMIAGAVLVWLVEYLGNKTELE
ncbi:MAG: DUF368 domain-containing protein [Ekhidna sp.]|nr:DUF368 domain-containing protein [Ekhidna sp.]MBC6410767.1 DUF368 domain-containing protein [Ekhidna sp.]MBC6427605.1 DUF368 domain-containing protein [Ekhidna sp.]